jgi:phospholipid/cholesterol/gamma-HCH transport system ATP-binding protein
MSTPAVVVDGLVKRFSGRAVLDGISFTLAAGETLAVLGRSGTGKSVLLKTIIALMDPDAGSVRVLGRDLHALDERGRLAARSALGYVFQGAALFDSLDVFGNVAFPLRQQRTPEAEVRSRVEQCLAMVGLPDVAHKDVSELSGGMRKRVGLARAIVHRPQVVLYDEPTTGLDPLTTDVIDHIILRLKRKTGAAGIVVSHDVESAFTVADRVMMLEAGHVVAAGTPEEIRRSENPWVQRFLAGDSGSTSGTASGSRALVQLFRPPG